MLDTEFAVPVIYKLTPFALTVALVLLYLLGSEFFL